MVEVLRRLPLEAEAGDAGGPAQREGRKELSEQRVCLSSGEGASEVGGGSRESRALGQLGEGKPGELSPCLTGRERELREQVEDMGDPPGSEEGEEVEKD